MGYVSVVTLCQWGKILTHYGLSSQATTSSKRPPRLWKFRWSPTGESTVSNSGLECKNHPFFMAKSDLYLWPERLKNNILWGRTYLHSQYWGVPPSPWGFYVSILRIVRWNVNFVMRIYIVKQTASAWNFCPTAFTWIVTLSFLPQTWRAEPLSTTWKYWSKASFEWSPTLIFFTVVTCRIFLISKTNNTVWKYILVMQLFRVV